MAESLHDQLASYRAKQRQRQKKHAQLESGKYGQSSVSSANWVLKRAITLADLVSCNHSHTGRCLSCSDHGSAVLLSDPDRQAHTLWAQDIFDRSFGGLTLDQTKQTADEEKERLVAHGVGPRELIYGEVCFRSFASLLEELSPREGEIFCDLGSGVGKAVLAAALLHRFRRVWGVEVMPELTALAHRCLARLSDESKHTDTGGRQRQHSTTPLDRIRLDCGDLRDTDWSDADIVFVASTSFGPELMNKVAQGCLRLSQGSRVVTLSQALPPPARAAFRRLFHRPYRFSWGECQRHRACVIT